MKPTCPKCGNDDVVLNPPTESCQNISAFCSRCKFTVDVELGIRGFVPLAAFAQFFADAEVRQTSLEEACKAMCMMCRSGIAGSLSRTPVNPATRHMGTYCHTPKGIADEITHYKCGAAAIRAIMDKR